MYNYTNNVLPPLLALFIVIITNVYEHLNSLMPSCVDQLFLVSSGMTATNLEHQPIQYVDIKAHHMKDNPPKEIICSAFLHLRSKVKFSV